MITLLRANYDFIISVNYLNKQTSTIFAAFGGNII